MQHQRLRSDKAAGTALLRSSDQDAKVQEISFKSPDAQLNCGKMQARGIYLPAYLNYAAKLAKAPLLWTGAAKTWEVGNTAILILESLGWSRREMLFSAYFPW